MKRFDESIKGANTPLGQIVARIVDGQIRSFLRDHPEALGTMRARSFRVGLSKRIINDLLCSETVQRMTSALRLVGVGDQASARGGLSARAAGDVAADTASPADAKKDEAA